MYFIFVSYMPHTSLCTASLQVWYMISDTLQLQLIGFPHQGSPEMPMSLKCLHFVDLDLHV